MLIEDIIAVVVGLILSVAVLVGGLALLSVQRRVTRRRYFQHLDEARRRVQELLEPLLQTSDDPDEALAALRALRTAVDRRALGEAVLRHAKVREELPICREIAKKLGWIDEWTQVLRSRAPRPTGTTAAMLTELGDEYRPPHWLRRIVLRARANFVKRCQAALEKATAAALAAEPTGD